MQSSFSGFPRPVKDGGGTKTGDATATANDIGLGLTAYAVGVKLTGTGVNAKNWAGGNFVASGTTQIVTGIGFLPKSITLSEPFDSANFYYSVLYSMNVKHADSVAKVTGVFSGISSGTFAVGSLFSGRAYNWECTS